MLPGGITFMRRPRALLALVLSAASFPVTLAVAQDTSSLARERACRQRVADTLHASGKPLVSTMLSGYCASAAPALLVERWQTPPVDRDALFNLEEASKMVPDERLLQAALAVAANRGLESTVRLRALETLFFYALDLELALGPPRARGRTDTTLVTGVGFKGRHRRQGDQPILPDAYGRILERMKQLSAAPGEDSQMKWAFVDMVRELSSCPPGKC
jgi:hypothetical protein